MEKMIECKHHLNCGGWCETIEEQLRLLCGNCGEEVENYKHLRKVGERLSSYNGPFIGEGVTYRGKLARVVDVSTSKGVTIQIEGNKHPKLCDWVKVAKHLLREVDNDERL